MEIRDLVSQMESDIDEVRRERDQVEADRDRLAAEVEALKLAAANNHKHNLAWADKDNRELIAIQDKLAKYAAENKRLQGIIDQHNLCHDLHGKVGVDDFAKGCAAEIKRIYGSCPWEDENKRLREAFKFVPDDWGGHIEHNGQNFHIAVDEKTRKLTVENKRLRDALEYLRWASQEEIIMLTSVAKLEVADALDHPEPKGEPDDA